MFDFIIRKPVIGQAQGFINRLNPRIDVHIPKDIPLPSAEMIKKMAAAVSSVNALEPKISSLSSEELRLKTDEFKRKYQEAVKVQKDAIHQIEGSLQKSHSHEERAELQQQMQKAKQDLKEAKRKVLDELLPEAFAVVRESGKRILSMRHFDVQLIGGMVLHRGAIAEMATGEGKTLVATLPAYLNALTGEGVHIVTVNDYLAKRDREWMGPLFESLGLTVGVIQHDMDPPSRQRSYSCDITYGTNNEFGFDYLRDNMVNFREEMVQRPHHFAIVDEVDSILIDEARTPLIISGPAEESTDKYYKAQHAATQLKGRRTTEHEQVDAKYRSEDLTKGYDYIAEEKGKSISLTDEGEERAAKLFGVANLHDIETMEYRHHILQALRAKEFFKIDVDYVIRDGGVMIVDEFTGRMMPGRRWSDGLHQAVEAKEGIKIERENQTLATITFQNYFRMYEKLAGMTGTAHTEATEFEQIYKLDCIVMPPNRILSRVNFPDSIYKTTNEKFDAVVQEIEEKYAAGQPVLVGTISIAKSEILSALLKKRGIPHQVLNAKYHELEAQIVAQAGRFKAVTIATNMAGRGTDILLGGNAEFLAKTLVEQKSKDAKEEAPDKDEMVKKFLTQFKEQVKQEHQKVVAAGGLHVIGTERHESRRIDNQLRGRSGRQGDPGSSRFYVSLEDDLMRLFGGDRIGLIMDRFGMEAGQVIEHPLVNRSLEIAQKRVESYNFEIRKQLLEFDDVMNKQREVIYALRRDILESDNVKDYILDAVEGAVAGAIQDFLFNLKDQNERQWDVEGLNTYLKLNFNYSLNEIKAQLDDQPQEKINELIVEKVLAVYQEKEKAIPAEHLRHIEKIFLLHTIDAKWKDHLYAMDQLKEGISLRAYAQRDPVVEYKREGFAMFQMMYNLVFQEVGENIFKIQPLPEKMRMRSVFGSLPQKMVHDEFSGLSARAQAAPPPAESERGEPPQQERQSVETYRKDAPKVGRNDPCPCGSGKKYKKCCGK